MANNLWGNFDDINEKVQEPKDILEEQAMYLKDGTHELVKGNVIRKFVDKSWKDFFSGIGIESDFCFDFNMYSDFIDKYSYTLCTLTYGIKMYPLAITLSSGVIEELTESYIIEDDDTIVVDNEEMLCEIISKVFTTKEVRQVLRGIKTLAQNEIDSQAFPFQ